MNFDTLDDAALYQLHIDVLIEQDRVSFDGGNYESAIDNNSWSPAVHPAGWKTV